MSDAMRQGLAENILTALCYDDECAAQLMMLITPDMFESEGMQLLATRAMEYIKKYNKAPRKHMYDLFEGEARRKGLLGDAFKGTLQAMERIAETLNPEYIIDELETFIGMAQMRKVMREAQRALDNFDIEGAKLAIASKDAQVSFDSGIWLHDPEQMLRFLNKTDDELYSSGIGELDVRNVRPARKTIMVLIAPPKAGKSWYLINQAKANLARRKSVLHVTCENSAELTAKRYIMSLYGMATHEVENVRLPFFDRLESGGYSMHLDMIDKPVIINETQRNVLTTKLRMLDKRPRLMIKEFASGTLSVPMLIAYMNMLEQTEHFKPDLVIVDYPKMMRIDSRNYRLDLGRIMIELRGLATDRNIAVSTVMQGGKTSKTAHTVTGTMVSEDYSIMGTADTIITYSQTSEEKKINLARILVDSARDTEGSYLVMISQSYVTGQFCLDSVYMTDHLQQVVAEETGTTTTEKEAEPNEVTEEL